MLFPGLASLRRAASIIAVSNLISGAVCAAAPAPVSVYGIMLGAPLSIEECPETYEEMCWVRFGTLADIVLPPKPGEIRTFMVNFASGGRPAIAKSNSFAVDVIERQG